MVQASLHNIANYVIHGQCHAMPLHDWKHCDLVRYVMTLQCVCSLTQCGLPLHNMNTQEIFMDMCPRYLSVLQGLACLKSSYFATAGNFLLSAAICCSSSQEDKMRAQKQARENGDTQSVQNSVLQRGLRLQKRRFSSEKRTVSTVVVCAFSPL